MALMATAAVARKWECGAMDGMNFDFLFSWNFHHQLIFSFYSFPMTLNLISVLRHFKFNVFAFIRKKTLISCSNWKFLSNQTETIRKKEKVVLRSCHETNIEIASTKQYTSGFVVAMNEVSSTIKLGSFGMVCLDCDLLICVDVELVTVLISHRHWKHS